MFDTVATCASLVDDKVSDTGFQIQNGSAYSQVFATLKCQFLAENTAEQLNNYEYILYAIPVNMIHNASSLQVPVNKVVFCGQVFCHSQ